MSGDMEIEWGIIDDDKVDARLYAPEHNFTQGSITNDTKKMKILKQVGHDPQLPSQRRLRGVQSARSCASPDRRLILNLFSVTLSSATYTAKK